LPGLWGDPGGGLLRITASHLGRLGADFGKFWPDFLPDFGRIFLEFSGVFTHQRYSPQAHCYASLLRLKREGTVVKVLQRKCSTESEGTL
jgi:hypothetical protein